MSWTSSGVFTSRASTVAGLASTTVKPSAWSARNPIVSRRSTASRSRSRPISRSTERRDWAHSRALPADSDAAELPGERRPDVLDQLLGDVDRALVLEQHGRALGRHHAVPGEGAGRPDAHDVDPGRVPDVRRAVEEADRQVVALHHRLQPGEAPGAQRAEVDLGEVRHAQRADAGAGGQGAASLGDHARRLLSVTGSPPGADAGGGHAWPRQYRRGNRRRSRARCGAARRRTTMWAPRGDGDTRRWHASA